MRALTEEPRIVPLRDKLGDELDAVQQNAAAEQPRVEPTEDEKRNGWTAESLTAYLAERNAGQSLSIDVNSLHRRLARRPVVQNHRYNPLRWR